MTTVLDLCGGALLVAGVYFVYWPAALILAGLLLLVVSWKASR